ncbi:MAG TPA: polymer-forming cytoskeletal protein [Tepidisphaeraceae bacterium]|jgi:cytoskeletal protein CcmA (bactofilin family)
MREERGTIAGDYTVKEPLTLWGSVGGNVHVVEGGKFYLRGAVYGDVICEYGGRMHIFGRVTGSLTVQRGAKVIHSGVLGGDATNEGGRLYIENTAVITGKVKTIKGETKISKLFSGDDTKH